MNIPFCDISIDSVESKERIKKGIDDIFQRSDYISGRSVKQFEDAFATYIGTKHCVGVANGTDALEIAIESLQLKEDSKILVQGNSYIATALAVINQRIRYKLELVDVDKETNMIDIEDLHRKMMDAKVLIITHLFGFMPNMDRLLHVCEENHILLIEDCAQAHGAQWKSQKAGTFGIVSCFSFYPTKNLGAFGDGGAIVTSDSILYNWIRQRANMGSIIRNQFNIIGRNSRLDTIQALVLYEKLPQLDKANEKRRLIAMLYTALLQSIPDIKILEYDRNCQPVYHLYVIRAKRRNELQEHLKQHGITSLIHYPTCIGKTTAFANIVQATTPNCEELSNEILSLPMYPVLLGDMPAIQYVTNTIRQFYQHSSMSLHTSQLVTSIIHGKSGRLHAVNQMKLPPIKRMFYVDGFDDVTLPVERGNHCNVNTNEYLTVLDGAILLQVEHKDGNMITSLLLKNDSIYIHHNTWIRYTILHPHTRLIVLCDTTYDEQMTEHDYNVFKGIFNSSRSS